MRVFIAIDCEELKEYKKKIKSDIDKNNAVMKLVDSFHLTLKFLGKVPSSDIPNIIDQLKKIEFQTFNLNLSSIGCFPNENYIRVVWVGADPKDKIIQLQQKVDDVLVGFEKNEDFIPHITLARVKQVIDKSKFKENLKSLEIDGFKEINVKGFKLMKSTLTPTGPEYVVIEEFKF